MNATPRVRLPGLLPLRLLGKALLCTAMALPACWANADDASKSANHVLIADQFNNRVIEVDAKTHQIIWQFGNGSDKPGPHSIVGVNDAERVGRLTLMSGTGIPPSSPPLPGCSDPVNGCPDNRVMLVSQRGRIVWQYGQAGVSGAGFNQLNTPVHAIALPEFSAVAACM